MKFKSILMIKYTGVIPSHITWRQLLLVGGRGAIAPIYTKADLGAETQTRAAKFRFSQNPLFFSSPPLFDLARLNVITNTRYTIVASIFCMASSPETAAALVQCSAHGTTDRSVLNVRWMNALRRRASYASYSYCVCVYIYVCDSILHLDCLHGQYATRSCINYLPQSFSSSDL